ncbi:MAG: phosphopantetheine-binding protein [Bacteroidota bacterium]|nr:phosphopantetheine-binding protein [Bacteroidota bacterium]MDP4190742.1 phosphopantetheine-binding protein [Bacteroidota bacterium]MDP4195504.1 phosphopantetheine-binding protein [Bacteroidota bacterium]
METKIIDILNSILLSKNKEIITDLEEKVSLRNDLGFDSLDLATLSVRIEDEFGIDIFEEKIIDKISELLTILHNNEEFLGRSK